MAWRKRKPASTVAPRAAAGESFAAGVVTKRKVTMTNIVATGTDDYGNIQTARHVATDYVRPDHLAAYVADAQKRWQMVEVSDEPDAGPGGYRGQTAVPADLAVPDAGRIYPADRAI